MRFLDKLDMFLTEGKDEYDLYPVDYDVESGVSFGVDQSDVDKPVSKIVIKTVDGTPIDALGGNYNYDEVYADVSINGDADDPAKVKLLAFVIRKLKKLGYDENSIHIDGEEVFRKTRGLDKDIGDDETFGADAEEIDFSSYWEKDEDILGTETETETDSIDTPIFEPVSAGEEGSEEGGSFEANTEETSEEEDDEGENDFTKKFSKKKKSTKLK